MSSTQKVIIFQPVVPHYRESLFKLLANSSDIELLVYASSKYPSYPPSVSPKTNHYLTLSPPAISLFSRFFFQLCFLRLPILRNRPDIVVISGNIRILSNIPIYIYCLFFRIPILAWCHGSSVNSNSTSRLIRAFYLKLFTGLILYYPQEVERYVSLGFDPKSLYASRNTVNTTSVLNAIASWPSSKLREFRINQCICDRRVILYSSRLTSSRTADLEHLLSVANILRSTDPSILFVIIGDGPARSKIENSIALLDLSNHVHLVGALYDEFSLAPWFLSAKCFFYPGTVGLSLIHSFTYSLPVVLHNRISLHNPEINLFRDGHNGLSYIYCSPSSAASAIRLLISDPSIRYRLSITARKTVFPSFSIQSSADSLLHCFRSINSGNLN